MMEGELTTTAGHRGTEAPKLIHLVRGDLDWIVMKALEKDRARRYETANGLAADIRRHLDNEPVNARPPSGFYRFQKMVRREDRSYGQFRGRLVVSDRVRGWRPGPGYARGDKGRALSRSRARIAPDVPAPGEQRHPLRGGHVCLRHTPTVRPAAITRQAGASYVLHGRCRTSDW
jgi:hypothetical protein